MRFRLLSLFLSFALLLAACGTQAPATTGPGSPDGDSASPTASDGDTSPSPTAEEPSTEPTAGATVTAADVASADATATAGPIEKLDIALFVNGSLGDQSFFDSANGGIQRAQRELGATVQVVEEPTTTSWEPSIRRLAQSERYDLIVLGTFQLVDALNEIAPDFPDQKFIFFDATVDQPNVANITYAQNEGSFLAGVLAACAANSDLEGATGDKVLGAVGGEDIAVINDFIVGYEQGAQYVDPEMRVLKAYVGTGAQAYNDPTRARELANAQLDEGASVIFGIAGGSGLGVINAAKDQGRYAIGVDSNQNAIARGTVLSSMLKRVDNSVFDLIRVEATGDLRTGRTYTYGIQNEGVGLAKDPLYERYVPEECQEQVESAEQDVASRKVRVKTAFE